MNTQASTEHVVPHTPARKGQVEPVLLSLVPLNKLVDICQTT